MFIAENFTQFKKLFVSRLNDMLSDDELGAFILVLANSQQDEFLKQQLNSELEKIFSLLKTKASSEKLDAPQDDVDVFNQLLSENISDIPIWQSRAAGEWEITYNSIRKLRPTRSSSQTFESIKQPFDETKFHFNKPFLKPEILWQGNFKNHQLCVLYNKFPFSDYHLLIAVSPAENYPQVLTQDMHDINFALVQDVAEALPGFGIGFNSLAAGASVNHLHCQGFVRQLALPIESNHWLHNGGEKKYPLQVEKFLDNDESWKYIEQLLQQDVAFNCVYREQGLYVITRQYQSKVELPEWLSGAGWLDVAGVMTVSEKETYTKLDATTVSSALSLLACGGTN